GADRIANILWRLENGELDGVNPKVIVVLAGTNDVAALPRTDETVENIARGIQAILRVCRTKAPNATVILTAIFPRNDDLQLVPIVHKVNERIARLADNRKVRFLDVNDRLADKDGRLFDGMMNAGDKLHPTVR